MSLQIKNLMFSFKKDIFIKDLNFEICRNQIGLVGGASGVGKSTLLNVISGLKKSDSGSIICNGQILNEEKKFVLPEKRNIETKFKLRTGPTNKIAIEKNKLKNKGITIKPIGIKNVKLSSKVNEFVIQ